MKAVFLERVDTVSEYDRVARSPSIEIRLPSVIALKTYIPSAGRPAFTRFNVFLRDRFSCQYCGGHYATEELTFDHVVPKSRGGRATWNNVVTACSRCNVAKGNRLPGESKMYPLEPPRMPTPYALQQIGQSYPPNFLHESWRDFLYWDSELDPS